MNVKEHIKTAGLFLLVLFSLFLFFSGYLRMQQMQDRVWLAVDGTDDAIPIETINDLQNENIKSKNPIAFVAWTEKKEKVFLEELNKYLDTIVISSSERVDILFPGSIVFDKTFPNTCVISEKLAYELFGTKDVKKLKITYKNQKYQISDIIKGEKKLFVYYAENKPEEMFDEITIENKHNRSPKMLKDKFEEKAGIELQYIDYGLPTFAFEILFIITIIIMGAFLVMEIRNSQKWASCMMVIILIGVGGIICSRFQGIPMDIIPTRMSDKAFWLKLIEEGKSSAEFLFLKKRLYPEEGFFYGKLAATTGLGVWLFSWIYLARRLKS